MVRMFVTKEGITGTYEDDAGKRIIAVTEEDLRREVAPRILAHELWHARFGSHPETVSDELIEEIMAAVYASVKSGTGITIGEAYHIAYLANEAGYTWGELEALLRAICEDFGYGNSARLIRRVRKRWEQL